MLEARKIFKAYGQLPVLKGIDLTISSGEVVAIVGASGAGKSTLLHIIGTLDRPDLGEVLVNNENVFGKNAKALAAFRNKNIGFVFQFHNLLPEFSALENVMIPRLIAGTQESEARERARELLALLGLSNREHHKPSELSGGEQQRAAVARALVNNPAMIMADEPSGNLDSHNARDLHRLFFYLRDKLGQAFVIVTHNEELALMADRRMEIRDGVFVG